MTTDILGGLNEQQRAAVTAGEGPVLVLAGPGSGKTRVLTHRIAYLIGEMSIFPDNIMAVTFTNKAASEMRTRVQHLLGGTMRGLKIGTFHAICARLLRTEWPHTPYGVDYVIFDTDDQVTAMTQTLGELDIDTRKWNPRRVLAAVSKAKNELIGAADYISYDYFGEVVARAFPRYQEILLDSNAMDFDDLLMQMVVLLRENDEVRDKYQYIVRYLLVDEFQDTNTAQYELVRHFGQPQGNVFVVGDEDQSIYAFRGADYRNVLQFRQDYPDAQIVLLEQNYRSTQNVLDAARAVIDKNPQRTPKALFTDRVGGTRLNVHEAYDERYEAGYVIETITRLRDDNPYDFNDFAVMYRTNAQSRALEEACVREGIPYRLVGGVGFYKRREVRDLLAYLRLVNNPNDKVSFSRIINVPKRGIGKKSLKDFQFWAAQADLTYDDALARLMAGEETPLSGRAAKQFATFGVMLAEWRAVAETGNLIELFDQIVSGNGYSMYLHEISDTPDQAMERSENVRELRGLVAEASDTGVLLADFLAEQALVSDVDELTDEANTITLLTLHSAKGLEFPVVFITGLEEGLLPHIRSFDDVEAMYEERRLMYVGLTRAKDQVCLTYAFRRMMWGSSNANTPSRFLSDIPIDLTEGVTSPIRHAADRQRFQRETSWEPSRLDRDLARQTEQGQTNKLRGKIIPFGGMSPPQSRFRSGQSVSHPTFGEGLVIEIKHAGDDEEVTVAFANKKHGIKTIDANFLTLAES